MEEALLGQKQIRHYFKCFSEPQWQRVAKATMMLGIQHIMTQNQKDHLFWDFSRLSVQELEDLVGKWSLLSNLLINSYFLIKSGQ